jgi:ADP-heptose:LPS heptosyltransferase
VPAFRALRTALPQVEIVLVGLPAARALVDRFNCYVDRLLELPGYPGLPEQLLEIQKIPDFLATVQAKEFDLAIQMHGSGTITNPLTVLLGARLNAGFFLPDQYCPDPERFLPYLPDEPEVRRYLRLLESLGIPPQGEDLEFPIDQVDRRSLNAIAEIHNLRPGKYVCVHPGASVPSRRWSPEQFAVVADTLVDYGLQVILTGSVAEVGLTETVAEAMQFPSLNLAGRTNLGALAALLSDARLLVCNDTGVSHLAAALRTPSVVIFTDSNPARWAPLNRDRHRVVYGNQDMMAEAAIAQTQALLQQERAYVT